MLFAIGTRVKFLHSDDEGVVTDLLDHGMVSVLLDRENMEIPAFIDDLIRAEDQDLRPLQVKAKIVPGKKEKVTSAPARPPIESQYTILKSMGLQLAFDPVLRPDATAERYRMFLINDTQIEVIFTLTFLLNGKMVRKTNGKLEALSVLEVGDMLFDQLNDSPSFEMECWRITTAGTGPRMHKTLKIKPKQFFKRVLTAPLLNRQVHLFRLFEKIDATTGQSKEGTEDLRSYTRRKAPARPSYHSIAERMPHEVIEYAEFIPEIDLHADKLTPNAHKLSKAEILRLQIFQFERFMEKAIRLGVERVFVIHGVGKGRLRKEIALRLKNMPDVRDFKNEYHPKYGFGATEVIL